MIYMQASYLVFVYKSSIEYVCSSREGLLISLFFISSCGISSRMSLAYELSDWMSQNLPEKAEKGCTEL